VNYRIELLFIGKAPASELERARILASAEVTQAIQALSKALEGAGLPHAVDCRAVREAVGRSRKVVVGPVDVGFVPDVPRAAVPDGGDPLDEVRDRGFKFASR
jgi:hypothetical protein